MSSPLLLAAREGVLHVVRRPLRSALEAVSVAVAIAVTVNVISVTKGLDADVRRDIGRFGRLSIDVARANVIRTGGERATFGPAEEATVARTLEGLPARIVPVRQAAATARGDAEVERLSLVAVGEDYGSTLEVPIAAGRWFGPSDPPGTAVVLDASAAQALFPGEDPRDVVSRTVTAHASGRALSLRVVGVLTDPFTYRGLFEAFDEGRGARTLASALLSFRNAYVPLDVVPGADLTRVVAVLPDEATHAEAVRRLREVWPDSPTSPIGLFVRKEWMDALGDTSKTGALLGNVVWIVVLLVAAVMITTLNLAGVRERYDEIAVRRCEGARRSHVAAQVGAEGVLVAVAGGLLGLPLGSAAAAVLSRLVDFPFGFAWEHAATGTAIACALGVLASVLPARRAARLDPARVLSRRVT
jgi:putative ABC transport system permease protein